MESRSSDPAEKQRERARIAADIAEYLRRGGVIKELATGTSAAVTGGRMPYPTPAATGRPAD